MQIARWIRRGSRHESNDLWSNPRTIIIRVNIMAILDGPSGVGILGGRR